jgi:hypothetical protein
MHRFIFLLLFFSIAQPITKCLLEKTSRSINRPEKDASALSPTGHFMVHYDIEGDAAPNLTDIDENGVPDYVDEVGIIADSTRKVLIEDMGFRAEVDDSDGIYDIYIMAFGTNYYGVNAHEGLGKSYIKIDNDYASGFYTTGIQVMRLTVAHEFFHAIQRAYKETQTVSDQFFYELTSTWIEDIIVPDGDDYLYWINNFFNNPQQSWDETDGYSLALFGHYLSTQFEDITSEKNSTIMREIWENISNTDSPYEILNGILQHSHNSSFQAAWLDFVSRNMFNDIFTDMDNDIFYYVDQGNELCTAPPISALFVDVDDLIEEDFTVSSSAVTIQVIKSKEDAVIQLNVSQNGSGYLGNIAYVLDSQNEYSLTENSGAEFLVPQFEKDEMIQFIYIASESTTSIGLNIEVNFFPDESQFLAIYPNPIYFGDAPILKIDITTAVMPQIIIYNLLGAEVVNTTITSVDKGRHDILLSPIIPPKMSSGVYVMDMILDKKIFTRKFTLIK